MSMRFVPVQGSHGALLDIRNGINVRAEAYLGRLEARQADVPWSSHSPFLSGPRGTADLLVTIAWWR